MAEQGNSPSEESIVRRKSKPIRVNYLRCLSTPNQLTLSRQSSLCTQSLRRTSGFVSVHTGLRGSPEADGRECFLCSHRELSAFLDDAIDLSVQPCDEEASEEEMEGTMKIPFQKHPALSPSTSLEPDPESECCICFNRRDTIQKTHVSCILMPCQHHQLCIGCANQVDMCPLCRELIQSRIPKDDNAPSVVEIQRKCLLRQFSRDPDDQQPHRKWQTAVIVCLCLLLAPGVFIAFHYIWNSWNIIKILVGTFLSGLVTCLAAVIVDRCFGRVSRRRGHSEELVV